MKGMGIKYQLRLTTLIPVFLVAILFAVFYNGQFSKDLEQHTSRLGKAYIRQLLPTVQLAMMRDDRRTLQGLINATTINPDIIGLTFYNAEGHIVAYRGGKHSLTQAFKPPAFTGDYIERKPINAHTLNFIAPITIPQFNLYTRGSYNKSNPIIMPGATDILGWLSITIDTRSVLIKRYQMYIITIFITLIGLLTSLAIHFFLSRRISIPIARLRRSMKQILSNEFETHIEVSSRGELGEIERGCAHLQKQYINTIHELNQHIEVATADLQQNLELVEEKNIELTLDKKKIEDKCRQKSEFIANMSHEIRTPMNGVIGFTNVLLESKLDTLQLDYVKTIQSSAQDLINIINDILDYSKMDAGKLHLDCIPLDLRACVDEVLALASPQAHKKGIDLIPSTMIDVPKKILGDPLRIKQLLTNLINNAIKFTERGYVLARTSIDRETDNDYLVTISVIDTGMGISPSDQSKLFNAFNQADTSITRRFGGTGLGLVICKKLAEAMGGRITLTSELHKGSTFTVTLKLEKLAAYEVEKNQIHRFGSFKAICFDDNSLQLEALCNGVGYWGINCIAVNLFNQLPQAFAENRDCQIAFINVNQGCEQQVAQVLKNQTIPCVLISKWLIDKPELLGAKAFLFKPISMKKLHDTIEFLLEDAVKKVETDIKLENLRHQLRNYYPELLIAEDNPVNRLLLNSLLGEYTVITMVANGEEAIQACEQKQFKALLLDLQMPKLNGLEAAQQIQEHSILNKNTPVLLISANTHEVTQECLQRSGIEQCLQKPIDEKSLLTCLLSILSLDSTPAIDWILCLQRVAGNQSLAEDFLEKFVEELANNRQEFLELFEQGDLKALSAVAHKLNGACCFCGVPRLQNSVILLEKQALIVNNIQDVQLILQELIKHIDEVFKEYNMNYQRKVNLT